MNVAKDAPLAPLTTFGIGGPARRLVLAESEAELVDIVRACDAKAEPVLIIGGGSNLVISDDGFDGTVVRVATRGIECEGDLVRAAAGEPWDDFVSAMVEAGLAGVECLAGIPGLVGATPMQNVGAYGQDVSETITLVRAFDRKEGKIVEIDRKECRFAYRTSAFKGKDRHVILGVTFALEASAVAKPIRYAELAKAVASERPPLEVVRSTIVELRRKKGMVVDPSDRDTASAGSFFTNPILDKAELDALRKRATGFPEFPEPDGRTKTSAAWLIEQAGFSKGYPGSGEARVSTKHALALTNRGKASAADVVALARTIRDGVRERFGVTLENEPVFVGVTL